MNIEIMFTSEEAKRRYGTDKLFGTPFSAAIDLRAAIDRPVTILSGEQLMIPTGIKINMMKYPHKCAALMLPRSGRGSKEGLTLGNTVGLIDQDYLGEMQMCVWARPTNGHLNVLNNRLGSGPIHIEPWERIAQLMFVPILKFDANLVDEFDITTVRGEGGHGSTGND